MTDVELSDEEQEKRRHAVRDLFPTTPYMGWLGIVFERYEHDDVVVRLPFRHDLTNDGVAYRGRSSAAASSSSPS